MVASITEVELPREAANRLEQGLDKITAETIVTGTDFFQKPILKAMRPIALDNKQRISDVVTR
ncbi:MAG: hypothetical protein RRY26_04515 [Cellulosilyticaceae bacterium]